MIELGIAQASRAMGARVKQIGDGLASSRVGAERRGINGVDCPCAGAESATHSAEERGLASARGTCDEDARPRGGTPARIRQVIEDERLRRSLAIGCG